jgi:hypothetical protein
MMIVLAVLVAKKQGPKALDAERASTKRQARRRIHGGRAAAGRK